MQTRQLTYPRGGGSLTDKWARLTLFLVIGYLVGGRSFAYLGLPWFSLYIGEMALAAFLLFGPRTRLGLWLRIALRIPELKHFSLLLILFLGYGAFQALRGILSGYPAFTAGRDTAFNYYPLFLFLGIWGGLRDVDLLRHVVRGLAWWNGCYGIAYVLFLNGLPWTMPGTANAPSEVPLFWEPLGSAISLLGLFALEPKLGSVRHLLAFNALVMLWVQVRAEWVAFIAGLLALAWCTKRVRLVLTAGALLVSLVGVMYLADIDLPSPRGRGGQISVNGLVARAVAPVNKDLADNLAPSEDVGGYEGTARWRLVWWAAIWEEVHANPGRALLGFGYGYPIGDLNPFIEPGTFIQTPHSDFLYALGFSGWVGVMLFAFLQMEILRLLWRSYRLTSQPFGLMCWSALVAASFFETFFDAPMGAIPFFLLAGIALAPGLAPASAALVQSKALIASPHAEIAEP
ncbi:MAG TPA: O-antigen ligase family protein [Candidatus Acidoferrum sp.]|nr:O-antigen ligase family protein [Candidatus Acidoferrum sp.]